MDSVGVTDKGKIGKKLFNCSFLYSFIIINFPCREENKFVLEEQYRSVDTNSNITNLCVVQKHIKMLPVFASESLRRPR